MKHLWKKAVMTMLLLLSVTAMTGCDSQWEVTLDPESLYALPKLPEEYTELNLRINELLNAGAEYAAPTSGTNIQPVQLVDLDGDGREEALAFFRNSSDEKPLKIYIFKNEEDTYRQAAVIEGSGTAIYSVSYQDLDNDGRPELLVGWRVSTELQVLSVYTLRSQGPEELIRTNYVKYTACSLEGTDKRELVVLRADEEGVGVAEHYGWRQGSLRLQSTARVSMTMAELSSQGRITSGYLQEAIPALFITGVTDAPQTITDILVARNGELTNIALSDLTGVSTELAPFSGLYPTDINNDSLTEVPHSVYLQNQEEGPQLLQRTDWSNYNSSGVGTRVMSTYHNLEDGWYLQLKDEWVDRIFVTRSSTPDEASVIFSIRGGDQAQAIPFLRISVFTGSNRELLARRGERFILSAQAEKIYAAELLEGNEGWTHGTTEEEVKEAFRLIVAEWVTGDY